MDSSANRRIPRQVSVMDGCPYRMSHYQLVMAICRLPLPPNRPSLAPE
jgi:hypothetical protein